jgi:hypothetical protein
LIPVSAYLGKPTKRKYADKNIPQYLITAIGVTHLYKNPERGYLKMDKRLPYKMLCLIMMIIYFNGCAGNLATYEPKNPEETAIKNLLLKWEKTYNSGDVTGNLSTWNDNAQIMYGTDRKLTTKKDYIGILPERMKAIPSLNLGSPDIKISGDKAEVKAALSGSRGTVPATFNLIKENNLWSIMSWKY